MLAFLTKTDPNWTLYFVDRLLFLNACRGERDGAGRDGAGAKTRKIVRDFFRDLDRQNRSKSVNIGQKRTKSDNF